MELFRRLGRPFGPLDGPLDLRPIEPRRFGRGLNDEMRILILHGILHLMGYDHETDSGQMDRREMRLRRQLGLA